MTETVDLSLHLTPLYDRHVALGAKLIEFGGWLMPLQYTGILEEHRAVRERAGLFDLSHMGELFVEGPEAGDALAYALVSDPRTLREGRAHYSMIGTSDGGIIDDLIVYRLDHERFLVVANAANAPAVSDALAERLLKFKAVLDDRSLAMALVADPGSPIGRDPRADHRYRHSIRCATTRSPRAPWPASRSLVARTGYTGEDGFEVFVEGDRAGELWDALTEAGASHGMVPVGLGARDTLRLEAGMPLYGNELDLSTNPFEAGQGRIVKLDKAGDFVGRAALERGGPGRSRPTSRRTGDAGPGHRPARLPGPRRRPADRRRHERDAVADARQGDRDGLRRPGDAEPGTIVDVEIREQRVAAEVVGLPFYRRTDG